MNYAKKTTIQVKKIPPHLLVQVARSGLVSHHCNQGWSALTSWSTCQTCQIGTNLNHLSSCTGKHAVKLKLDQIMPETLAICSDLNEGFSSLFFFPLFCLLLIYLFLSLLEFFVVFVLSSNEIEGHLFSGGIVIHECLRTPSIVPLYHCSIPYHTIQWYGILSFSLL